MKYKLKGGTDSDIVRLVCNNRKLIVEDLQAFLNPCETSKTNPMIYINMEEAINLFAKHIKGNSKIVVLVDSDTDGYCSSATLINYIKVVFPHIETDYILHEEKKHGLTPEIMEKIQLKEPDLLIIPDASSGDVKQHKELKELCIDVIVLDHHEFDELSENAIVVTNQIGQGNKTLSGGGMVMKFLEQIDSFLGIEYSKFFCDLVGTSLVADSMMMVQPETRYYVTQGLDNINNPLLQSLISEGRSKNFDTISYDIAPTINAFIRVGTEEEKQDLFQALIGVQKEKTVKVRGQGELVMPLNQYIATISSRIKSRQTREIKKALEHKDLRLFTDNLPITIAILDAETRPSLTGLIASKLVEQYMKPALVLKEKDNGTIAGSGRSTDTFTTLKDYINDINISQFCAGHQSAFGIGFESLTKLFEFMSFIQGKTLGEDSDAYLVDKIYPSGASAYDIMAIDELKDHWCRGFERPLFYIKLENVNPNDLKVVGKNRNTIRITHNFITYIKFKCSEEEVSKFLGSDIQDIELVGYFSVNEFNGSIQPQVEIERMEYTIKKSKKMEQIQKSNEIQFGEEFGSFGSFAW